MINKDKLALVLTDYRKDFNEKKSELKDKTHWEDEKYKWIMVKYFQDHWDINAKDFASMFKKATAKHLNILTARNYFPRGMILDFAAVDPEAVRKMFIDLFDESVSLVERINGFISEADRLRVTYGADKWKSHYQNINSISTYLWSMYPDKYYIYKYSECKKVSEVLESDYVVKSGAKADAFVGFVDFYNEIADYIKDDIETTSMLKAALTPDCYPDPQYRTLTIDVGFYISRYYSKKQDSDDEEFDESDPSLYADEWFPSIQEYTPGISKEQWLTVLNDKEIIGPVWGGALAAFYEAGGQATCKQIAEKYNKTASGISGNCTQLAKRIHKKTQCPLSIRENGKKRYWSILFQGKNAGPDVSGGFIWKLRPELYEALTEFDIMRYKWKTEEEKAADSGSINYWWLNANPKIWRLSDLGVGEAEPYTLYNENGNKRRIFQNFLDAKAGDMIIGYEANPVKQIVAVCRVSKEQDGKEILIEKVEGLASPIDYAVLKACPELSNMEYFQNPQGSLFKLSRDEYDFIMDIIRDYNPLQREAGTEKYTKDDFLSEVYMTGKRYDTLVGVLKRKKNIILQGAPGVGKTFAAKRLAWSVMGEKDDSRIEFIQFHQNYSYEDFMMGYKPVEDGFELKYGVFYRFCQKAANEPDKDFFFIIDEINRGNISKIFGELLMLIENEYRGTKATLAYNGMPFSVPENLYIIGMMNTADRSLSLIDYALRRRFSFFDVEPGFDSEGFITYQKSLNNETFNILISKVKELNREITLDKSLGRGFCIGHSYFCGRNTCTEEWLRSVVDYDILPMISEYWFDDPDKIRHWEAVLQGVFQ